MELSDIIKTRFADAPWILKGTTAVVGGVGGIGSNLSYLLAKIGLNMALIDADKVEDHNIGGQMFDVDDIDKYKTEAITEKILNIDPSLFVYPNNQFLTKENAKDLVRPICFSCFDNMKARVDMFNAWEYVLSKKDESYNSEKEIYMNMFPIFIDGRQESETFQVYAVPYYNVDGSINNEGLQRYKETLFNDREVPDLPCNFKSTTHVGFMTSATMISVFTNFITNMKTQEVIREVPFKIEFNIPLMLYETTT